MTCVAPVLFVLNVEGHVLQRQERGHVLRQKSGHVRATPANRTWWESERSAAGRRPQKPGWLRVQARCEKPGVSSGGTLSRPAFNLRGMELTEF